ncbi:MAG: DUF3817 domain-containing protein [Myxococcaceae bacterium]|nr:DUF3817 domain-containing protein [Myxococcaceae bacterium]MCI0669832.1 DUF3817 domain-containing protein [Myxococcaceae bacterium]
MLNTPTGRLRTIGWIEGASFLILLFIAMPLKYFAGMPLAVKWVGWAHGFLFVLYLMALGHAASEPGWTMRRISLALVASVLPFGPFVFDAHLRREERGLSV